MSELKISDLEKGLVFDLPMTSDWLQSATEASDKSASRIHVPSVGSPTFGTDGVELDGSTKYLYKEMDDFRIQDTLGTFSVWYKRDDAITAVRQDIFTSTEGDVADTSDYWLSRVNFEGDRRVRFYMRSDSTSTNNVIRSTSLMPNDSDWHHIVFSSNGSRYQMYIDSVLEAHIAQVGVDDGKWLSSINNRDSFTIGVMMTDQTFISHWYGKLRYLKFWNRELDADAIQTLYRLEI